MIPFVQFRIRRFSLLDLFQTVDCWILSSFARLVSMNDAEILGDQLFIVHNVAGVAANTQRPVLRMTA